MITVLKQISKKKALKQCLEKKNYNLKVLMRNPLDILAENQGIGLQEEVIRVSKLDLRKHKNQLGLASQIL